MGRGSGGLIALIGLVLILSRDKVAPGLPPIFVPRPPLTAEAFSPTFVTPPITADPITYKQYYEFATQPAEDVEADPAITLTPMEHPVLDRPPGGWLTVLVNDVPKIPTPTGKLIPLPTRRVGRIAVETMLEPIGEEKPEQYFADVEYNGKIRKSISARLVPL